MSLVSLPRWGCGFFGRGQGVVRSCSGDRVGADASRAALGHPRRCACWVALFAAMMGVLIVPSAAFASAQWSAPMSVDSAPVVSVSCPSASFCVAVDVNGNTVTFNGSSWSAPASIDGTNVLSSVSCPSAAFCAAVDVNGNTVNYNGSSWSAPSSIDSGHVLSSVSCPSSSFCVAVDSVGRAVTFNGSSWSAPASIDGTNVLSSVSCPSASFCAAVDRNGNAVTFNGSSWSAPTSIDGTYSLSSVSCPSASFCAAVDVHFSALTFNGSSWSAPVPVVIGPLRSVSCPSVAFCVAVGGPYALPYDGFLWGYVGIVKPIDSAGLRSVSCPSAAFCAAVDDAGNALIYSTPPPSPSNTSRPTISGNAVEGRKLLEGHGTWTNNPTRFSYQWEDCNTSGGACSAISNASQGYLIRASDVGHTIRIQETASNTTGSSRPASSAPTALVKALPKLSALIVSPRTFPAARSGPSVTRASRLGTEVHYKLKIAASVRFTIQRAADGRQVGRRCEAPSRNNIKKRRCTRYLALRGSFTVKGHAGNNSFRFSGRLNTSKLAPGKYRLIATPTANGVTGSAQNTTFTIKR
jgi:hypothetical protein